MATVIAVVLGGIHFAVGARNNSLHLRMGVMYYVQVRNFMKRFGESLNLVVFASTNVNMLYSGHDFCNKHSIE